jgi:hypothetical protein
MHIRWMYCSVQDIDLWPSPCRGGRWAASSRAVPPLALLYGGYSTVQSSPVQHSPAQGSPVQSSPAQSSTRQCGCCPAQYTQDEEGIIQDQASLLCCTRSFCPVAAVDVALVLIWSSCHGRTCSVLAPPISRRRRIGEGSYRPVLSCPVLSCPVRGTGLERTVQYSRTGLYWTVRNTTYGVLV